MKQMVMGWITALVEELSLLCNTVGDDLWDHEHIHSLSDSDSFPPLYSDLFSL